MKRFEVCRKVNADIWGECLFTHKSLRLLNSIYRPRVKHGKDFVLRIDKIVPPKLKRPLSKFSLGKVDKAKFAAFYDYNAKQFRHLVLSFKRGHPDTRVALLTHLESQLHVILFRTQFFRLQSEIKRFIYYGNVFVNPIGSNPIPQTSPGFHVSKYDFITFNRPNLNHFQFLRRKRFFRLRDHHIFINHGTFSIFFYDLPNPSTLFHFFPFEYANIFFTPRLH